MHGGITIDVVHRTHLRIFREYYPPQLDNWCMPNPAPTLTPTRFTDSWIVYAYVHVGDKVGGTSAPSPSAHTLPPRPAYTHPTPTPTLHPRPPCHPLPTPYPSWLAHPEPRPYPTPPYSHSPTLGPEPSLLTTLTVWDRSGGARVGYRLGSW